MFAEKLEALEREMSGFEGPGSIMAGSKRKSMVKGSRRASKGGLASRKGSKKFGGAGSRKGSKKFGSMARLPSVGGNQRLPKGFEMSFNEGSMKSLNASMKSLNASMGRGRAVGEGMEEGGQGLGGELEGREAAAVTQWPQYARSHSSSGSGGGSSSSLAEVDLFAAGAAGVRGPSAPARAVPPLRLSALPGQVQAARAAARSHPATPPQLQRSLDGQQQLLLPPQGHLMLRQAPHLPRALASEEEDEEGSGSRGSSSSDAPEGTASRRNSQVGSLKTQGMHGTTAKHVC